MRKIQWMFVCAIMAMMTFACATAEKGKWTSEKKMLNGEWLIVSVDTIDIKQNETDPVFIGFDLNENRAYGYSGCNMFSGQLQIDSLNNNGELIIGPLASTRRACLNDQNEFQILVALDQVRSFKYLSSQVQDSLRLFNAGGDPIVVLVKKADSQKEK